MVSVDSRNNNNQHPHAHMSVGDFLCRRCKTVTDYIERKAAIEVVKHALEPTQYTEEIPAANTAELEWW